MKGFGYGGDELVCFAFSSIFDIPLPVEDRSFDCFQHSLGSLQAFRSCKLSGEE